MEIRKLLPADAAAFQMLRLAALREEPAAFGSSFEEESAQPLSFFAASLERSPDRAVFGAFDGLKLAGTVGLGRESMRKLRHKGYIWGMYVAPRYRRTGVGMRLLEAALRYAETVDGLRQVNLRVNADNAGAIRLYAALGFETFGTERNAMNIAGTLVDELHMVRVLTRPALPPEGGG